MARKLSLAEQIKTALSAVSESGDKTCCKLILLFYKGSEPMELKAYPISKDQQYDPGDIASMFDTIAETYAQGLQPGRHQFELVALFEGDNDPFQRMPFAKFGAVDVDGLQTEGPTERGLVMQMMRHNEALMRTVTEHSVQMFERTNLMIDRLGAENDRLRHENSEAFEVVRTIMMDKSQIDFDNKQKLIALEDSKKTKQQFLKLLPAIANSLSGKNIFPQSTADTALVEMLAEHLTAEQAIEFASKIENPLITGMIMDRFKDAIEAKQAKQLVAKKEDNDGNSGNEE